jgi:hypothetical protein
VTNTGQTPLGDVEVSDPLAASFENQTIEALAVGETKTFIVEHELTEALTNVATASVDIDGETIAVADDAAVKLTTAASTTPPQQTAPTGKAGKSRDGLAVTGFGAYSLVTGAAVLLLAGVAAMFLCRRSIRRHS